MFVEAVEVINMQLFSGEKVCQSHESVPEL